MVIGRENRTPTLQQLHAYLSTLSCRRRLGGRHTQCSRPHPGTEYDRMISLVSYVARVLETVMSRDASNN